MRKRSLFSVVLIVLLLASLVGCFATQEDDPWTNSDGTPIVCRRQGCGRTPKYPDWERRFCEEHILDTHYCRHPDCYNQIPNESGERYCEEHQE